MLLLIHVGFFLISSSEKADIKAISQEISQTVDWKKEIKVHHDTLYNDLVTTISRDTCSHVYIDMGSNIGVQFRKLYQPEHYPGAKILPVFNSSFGVNRRTVCSIGFEANHKHSSRLLHLQNAYRQASYPCFIFTNTAVWVQNGYMTFYDDPTAPPQVHEWGASLVHRAANATGTDSLTIDASFFINNIVHRWHKSQSYSNNSKVVVKMDIEGAEFDVLPHMLVHGSLCFIDYLTIEWHGNFYPTFTRGLDKKIKEITSFLTSNDVSCKFKILEIDDETYVNDTDVALPVLMKSINLARV